MVDIEATEAPVATRPIARHGAVRPVSTLPRSSGPSLTVLPPPGVPPQPAAAAERAAEPVESKVPQTGSRSRLRWPLMLEPVLFAVALAATLLALNNYLNQGVMSPSVEPSGQSAPAIAKLAVANPR